MVEVASGAVRTAGLANSKPMRQSLWTLDLNMRIEVALEEYSLTVYQRMHQ